MNNPPDIIAEKVKEFDKWFGHGKKGHLHCLLSESYYKEVKEFLVSSLTQVAEENWSKGWLNGVEVGMNYFDTTGVSGTKVPGTDMTIKQKAESLREISTLTKKEKHE